ncbi:RNA polymerase sigma factor [Parvicella tangerina]|uniref:ECF RNA polymerase sigma factor SigW n=1 Tax=Parvicella tangerina TaxID=2829795 RepID=A0A916JNA2_9FLAO|nr:RNA polymerase sigma factor [Parvicella tangerina]CAG5083403.1 ECF RNA polymerase sigma factor SigW [Parvicella tangerina]
MKVVGQKYKVYSDEDLMAEVIKGNDRAFSEIYDRYSRAMLNYFYKMLWQDRELAEDFMQELFTKIIHKPNLFNVNRSFKTWIYSIANNMCKNEYRKQEVRKGTSNNLNENISVANDTPAPDKKHDQGVFNDRLKEELNNLSDNHKNTFILRFKHDLSIKEIAEIMETSEGTVKSRIFYTLKKLSENLKEFKPIGASVVLMIITAIKNLF